MSSAVLDIFLFSTHRLLVRLFAVWVRFVCFQQRNNLDAGTSSSALRVATVHATDRAVVATCSTVRVPVWSIVNWSNTRNFGKTKKETAEIRMLGPGGGQTVHRRAKDTDLELDLPGSGHRCCYCSDGTAGPAVILVRFIRSSSVGLDNTFGLWLVDTIDGTRPK